MPAPRKNFDLNHYSFSSGQIGHLQTLSVIPVLAGDSFSLNMNNLMRLSPLRRILSVDAQVDYFAFYVPHRHVYGDAWLTFIKEGLQGSSLLDLITLGTVGPNGGNVYYMGGNFSIVAGQYAKWMFTGYNQIWNRYFRFLKLTPEVPDDYNGTGTPVGHTADNSPLDGDADMRLYGFPCARLKTPWTTGIDGTIVDADRRFALTDGNTTLDIIDLEQAKKTYKTQVEREWFANRYTDVLKNTFGSGVNIDADQRPELLNRMTVGISGHDVDGTDDATLGSHVGKAIAGHQFNVRRKFIPEGGAVWVMALVRFPTLHHREYHPILQQAQDYLRIAGDYDAVRMQPPAPDTLNTWTQPPSISNHDLGTIAYGQWYRHQQNVVHVNYEAIDGYPFLGTGQFGGHRSAVYVGETDYDDMFQSESLGQWQSQAAIRVSVKRRFPTARDSLFAGA